MSFRVSYILVDSFWYFDFCYRIQNGTGNQGDLYNKNVLSTGLAMRWKIEDSNMFPRRTFVLETNHLTLSLVDFPKLSCKYGAGRLSMVGRLETILF